jgi:hypothetical protein
MPFFDVRSRSMWARNYFFWALIFASPLSWSQLSEVGDLPPVKSLTAHSPVVGAKPNFGVGVHRPFTMPLFPHLAATNGTNWMQSASEEPATPWRTTSSYVALDSWVYPALERLQGLGYVDSGFLSIRPWTRLECARLTAEARGITESLGNEPSEATKLVVRLTEEFAAELGIVSKRRFRLSSIYVRYTNIVGQPLTDGYHFGQTMVNDFGRPYQEGHNAIVGMEGVAEVDRWTVHFRGEYQHAPSAAAPTASMLASISGNDATPLQPGGAFPARNHVRLLEGYVGLTAKNWFFTFGKQSLWWGQGASGALNFSNNADAIPMFRINRTIPLTLPGFLRYMGPLRVEAFFGRLTGHKFIRTSAGLFGPGLEHQPLIHGQKIVFKPTPHFEFGASVTTMYGGDGFPLTFRSFIRSFSLKNVIAGEPNDPGDRRAGFDFRYRIPGLRRWLTLYNDSMAEDEFSPVGYPRRSAMQPGLYLSQVPGIPKLDLRAEGFYTDLPGLRGTGVYYFNTRFLHGFTNAGDLMGHWIGRQGTGFQASTTYWAGPQRTVTLAYRQAQVSKEFLTGGGQVRNVSSRMNWEVSRRVVVSAGLQYERWRYPVLAGSPRRNLATNVQISFKPENSR